MYEERLVQPKGIVARLTLAWCIVRIVLIDLVLQQRDTRGILTTFDVHINEPPEADFGRLPRLLLLYLILCGPSVVNFLFAVNLSLVVENLVACHVPLVPRFDAVLNY